MILRPDVRARFDAVWHRALEREKSDAEIIKRVVIPDPPLNDSVVPVEIRRLRHKRSMIGRAKKKKA